MASVNDILSFWFGTLKLPEDAKPRPVWFRKDPTFDDAIRQRFARDYDAAVRGERDTWRASAPSCLALIILFDQFPRNLFRNDAQTFATDELALSHSEYALAQGFDQDLQPIHRLFMYLPFEHSENLVDQKRSIGLFKALRDAQGMSIAGDYAERHMKIIERFGRFPHRNAVLDRESTTEELAFLQQPGSSF